MLHKDYITKLLDLEYADVENLSVSASEVEIHLRLERRTCECPACGALTDAVHDYRTQRVKDIPVQGKPVILVYRKRRYRCMNCGKRFYEKNCLLPRWHRITNRLAFYAMNCMQDNVVRHACWALENVRKRVQKKLLPEQRKYFKRSRKLLLARMKSLSPEAKLAVERMLLFDRDLREAYLLKEKFYEFTDSSSSREAKQRLRAFRMYASLADLAEFQPVLTMLRNWEPYILNAFDCPYTNGFTEGSNNRIKTIKRTAFGYRNFHNFRARILASFNANGS